MQKYVLIKNLPSKPGGPRIIEISGNITITLVDPSIKSNFSESHQKVTPSCFGNQSTSRKLSKGQKNKEDESGKMVVSLGEPTNKPEFRDSSQKLNSVGPEIKSTSRESNEEQNDIEIVFMSVNNCLASKESANQSKSGESSQKQSVTHKLTSSTDCLESSKPSPRKSSQNQKDIEVNSRKTDVRLGESTNKLKVSEPCQKLRPASHEIKPTSWKSCKTQKYYEKADLTLEESASQTKSCESSQKRPVTHKLTSTIDYLESSKSRPKKPSQNQKDEELRNPKFDIYENMDVKLGGSASKSKFNDSNQKSTPDRHGIKSTSRKSSTKRKNDEDESRSGKKTKTQKKEKSMPLIVRLTPPLIKEVQESSKGIESPDKDLSSKEGRKIRNKINPVIYPNLPSVPEVQDNSRKIESTHKDLSSKAENKINPVICPNVPSVTEVQDNSRKIESTPKDLSSKEGQKINPVICPNVPSVTEVQDNSRKIESSPKDLSSKEGQKDCSGALDNDSVFKRPMIPQRRKLQSEKVTPVCRSYPFNKEVPATSKRVKWSDKVSNSKERMKVAHSGIVNSSKSPVQKDVVLCTPKQIKGKENDAHSGIVKSTKSSVQKNVVLCSPVHIERKENDAHSGIVNSAKSSVQRNMALCTPEQIERKENDAHSGIVNSAKSPVLKDMVLSTPEQIERKENKQPIINSSLFKRKSVCLEETEHVRLKKKPKRVNMCNIPLVADFTLYNRKGMFHPDYHGKFPVLEITHKPESYSVDSKPACVEGFRNFKRLGSCQPQMGGTFTPLQMVTIV